MGKGLNTKSGRMAQMIRHGANPNVFDPNGLRVVTANFDHDYSESYEFDTRRRRGVNGAYFNAVTDGMAEGQLEGALCYNLMDDQVLPYLLAKCLPADDVVANGKRQRIYYWPQYDRADREFFAFEEGRSGSVLRGGFGMFSSFKLTSKTGKKSSLTATIPFVTQAPVRVAEMTGGSPQNGKFRVSAANVTGDLTLGIVAGALAKKNVTLPIGFTKAQIEAAFAAQGLTVASAGTVAIASGEIHRLIATNATGNATIYDTIVVTPGMSAIALQNAIQAKGGTYANRTVTGSTNAVGEFDATAPGEGSPTATGSFTGNATAAFDDNAATSIQLGTSTYNAAVIYTFAAPQRIKAVKADHTQGPNAYTNGFVEASASGDFTDAVRIAPTSGIMSKDTRYAVSDTTYFKAIRYRCTDPGVNLVNLEILVDKTGNGTYVISTPANVGDVPDIAATPGVGWSATTTQPGAAGGQIDFEVTAPPQTRVVVTKEAGVAGYVLTTQQQGGKDIASAIAEPMPIEPGHLRFYQADTLAGLDAPTAFISTISEMELDVPKLCEPHHFHNNTESGPISYSAHKEPDDLDVMLTVTLPTDENGDCAGLTDGTLVYVSKESYWRVKAVCPISGYEQQFEFFGSVGKSIPLTYNENVEERKFVFNLLENRVTGWNFRWISRVPA